MANEEATQRPLADDEIVDGPAGDATIDLRATEPLVDLREAPTIRFTAPRADDSFAPTRSVPAREGAAVERRGAVEKSRFVAVVVIAALNVFDLITTYVAISHGAHESNPIVAWMISSHVVVLAKIGICGSLIVGVVMARRRRRRVTLASLCMAWAVVGVYSLVVVINTLTVWAHLR